MSTVVKPYTFSPGATIVAAEHNENFDTIYDDYNGGITNANINASAAISITKISIGSTDPIYLGSSSVDGSWKIYRSGNNLMFARRESAVWVDYGGFNP